MPSLTRRVVAEGVGTFALVFFGCAAVLVNVYPGAKYDLLGIALVHAVVLGVMITATMNISGGHLNPAVTIGLWSGRRIDGRTAAAYVAVQLLAGVLAAFAVRLLVPANVSRIGTLGTPAIASTMTLGAAIALEAVLTFFLVFAVYGTAVAPTAPKVGGFGIGLVLFFDIMIGGPLTGAAMNPARAFGPALVSGTWFAQVVWWVGPIVGGVVAAQVWERVLLAEKSASGKP
ncbi:MAG TPA: aquaporin [Gemmatimonadales bacterium]|nr:aquaporin [Gemmatimonadales bacterium]